MLNRPRHDHQRQEARHHEVLDRVDAQHLERVELLADLAGAEVRGDRGAADAGEDDGRHERRELADRGEHEEAAEPVDRAEQDQEVAGLKPGRAVAERDRRDRQRQPAEPQHEQELLHELGAVRVRRPQRRHQRLAGQDHHVPDLLQQVLGRQEDPIGCGSDHYRTPPQGEACSSETRTREKPMACASGPPEGTVRGADAHTTGALMRFGWYVRPALRGVERLQRLCLARGRRLRWRASARTRTSRRATSPSRSSSATFPEKQKLAQELRPRDHRAQRRQGDDPEHRHDGRTASTRRAKQTRTSPTRAGPRFALNGVQRGDRRLPRGQGRGPARVRHRLREHLGVRAAQAGPAEDVRAGRVTAVQAGAFKVALARGRRPGRQGQGGGGGRRPGADAAASPARCPTRPPTCAVADDGKTVVNGTR